MTTRPVPAPDAGPDDTPLVAYHRVRALAPALGPAVAEFFPQEDPPGSAPTARRDFYRVWGPSPVRAALAAHTVAVTEAGVWWVDGLSVEFHGTGPAQLFDGAADTGLRERAARLSSPRLVPVVSLGAGGILFLLKGYAADHSYVAEPVLLDPRASSPWRVAASRTPSGLRGSEIATSWRLADPGRLVLVGEFDASGDRHLDSSVPVATGYVLDLKTLRCTWADPLPAGLEPPARLLSANLTEQATAANLKRSSWDAPKVTLSADGAFTVQVPGWPPWSAPAERRLGEASRGADRLDLLVAAVHTADELLFLDYTAGDRIAAWHVTGRDAARR